MYEITLDYRSLSYGNDRIVRAHPVSDKLLIDKAIKILPNIIIVIPTKNCHSRVGGNLIYTQMFTPSYYSYENESFEWCDTMKRFIPWLS